jgi:hypothetical protein
MDLPSLLQIAGLGGSITAAVVAIRALRLDRWLPPGRVVPGGVG